MNNSFIYLLLSLAGIFSPIAGAMAFLIAYNEYSRHFLDRKKAMKLALQMAIFTFTFFSCLLLFLDLGFINLSKNPISFY